MCVGKFSVNGVNMNVSFCGTKVFNGIRILGEPMERPSSHDDDVAILKRTVDSFESIAKPECKFPNGGHNLPVFENGEFKLNFFDGFSCFDSKRFHITDLKEKVTYMLNKEDFLHATAGKKLYNELLGGIRKII